jgi:hypothetical protein
MIVVLGLALATVVAISAGSLAGPQTVVPSIPPELLVTPDPQVGPNSDPGPPLPGPSVETN